MTKQYIQKPNVKISREFKDKLMKIKLDFGFKDVEEVIKKMYFIINKFKLIKEFKNE